MQKFKIGDIVKITANKLRSDGMIGAEYVIAGLYNANHDNGNSSNRYIGPLWWLTRVVGGSTSSCYCYEPEMELVSRSKKNTIMDIKEKFILARKKEPQKSFFKAGITDEQDMLTKEGKEIYLTWRLAKDEKEFNEEVVQDLLKEEEKEKK